MYLMKEKQGGPIPTGLKRWPLKSSISPTLLVLRHLLQVQRAGLLTLSIHTIKYHRIVGRLISKVTLFKPSIFVSSYGTVLMYSFVVWFNMCGDRSHFLFTKFSFTGTSS